MKATSSPSQAFEKSFLSYSRINEEIDCSSSFEVQWNFLILYLGSLTYIKSNQIAYVYILILILKYPTTRVYAWNGFRFAFICEFYIGLVAYHGPLQNSCNHGY